MGFGKALSDELSQIEQLKDKVFPIVALEGTLEPYLIFRRNNAEFEKTLDGTSNNAHAVFDIMLNTKDYLEKDELEDLIKNKLLSFENRTIVSSNIMVEEVKVKFLTESYNSQLNSFNSQIQLEVDYI